MIPASGAGDAGRFGSDGEWMSTGGVVGTSLCGVSVGSSGGACGVSAAGGVSPAEDSGISTGMVS